MRRWSHQVNPTVSKILPFACSTRIKRSVSEDRRILEWRRILFVSHLAYKAGSLKMQLLALSMPCHYVEQR
jgi:hypothetical protein